MVDSLPAHSRTTGSTRFAKSASGMWKPTDKNYRASASSMRAISTSAATSPAATATFVYDLVQNVISPIETGRCARSVNQIHTRQWVGPLGRFVGLPSTHTLNNVDRKGHQPEPTSSKQGVVQDLLGRRNRNPFALAGRAREIFLCSGRVWTATDSTILDVAASWFSTSLVKKR